MSSSTDALNLSPEVLQRRVFRPDLYELHKTYYMLSLTRPFVKGKSVIDVGAAVGMYSYFWATEAEAARVYSFEPVPPVFEQLNKTAQRLDNIMIFNEAVGSNHQKGTVDFWVDDKRLSNSGLRDLVGGQKIEVPCVTLDDYFTQADFIKIDVEGNELSVISGGHSLITNHFPVLMVEIYPKFNDGPVEDTFRYLYDLGYKAHYSLRTDPYLRKLETWGEGVDISNDEKLGIDHDYDFLFIKE